MENNEIVSTYAVKDAVSNLRGDRVLLTPKQKQFLVALSESGDGGAAAKDAGYRNLSEALESPFVRAEAIRIQDAWGYELRMNSRYTAGEHMRLMEKFEAKYDSIKESEKPKMAAVLAKMSDTSLKASGKMNPWAQEVGASVKVEIHIGATPAESMDNGSVIEIRADNVT